ncbi:MAG: hypothetical protein FJW27_12445 [Acidimicrobiia bacterium]|nr:hypothetical protein [Acidimicrobiia bacterium]
MREIARLHSVFTLLLIATMVACGKQTITPTTPSQLTPPTPPPAPTITIAAPTLVEPPSGATSFGWPRFTWNNSSKTNTANALVYRFELSTREDFSTVAYTTMVPEGPEQTSFNPPATQATPAEGRLFWRVVAIDQANAVQSQPSATENFNFIENTPQQRVAVQLYGSLWTHARPTGTRGRARFGPGWNVGERTSFTGVRFMSPPLDVLRMYDLLDLGMDPSAAINWMRSNGYANEAAWYPNVWSIGFQWQYMTLLPQNFATGAWELVHRVGA